MKKTFIFIFSVVLIALFVIIYNQIGAKTLPKVKEKIQYMDNYKTALENYKYKIADPEKQDNFFVYVIIQESQTLDFKCYSIRNNDKINMEIPKNKKFIVSLHSNATIAADWQFREKETPNVEQGESYFISPKHLQYESKEQTYGWSERRKNFSFTTKGKGSAEINFQYRNISTNELFNHFSLNLNIK